MSEKLNKLTEIDVRIAIAVGICVLSAFYSPIGHGQPVLQSMTACISVLLCAQDTAELSKKAGMTRMLVTLVGGVLGVVVVVIDDIIQIKSILIVLIIVGIAVTLAVCRAMHLPYINAKIGGVTFILVTLTKTGSDRIIYAGFRLLSTFYGACVILAVTLIWQMAMKKRGINE